MDHVAGARQCGRQGRCLHAQRLPLRSTRLAFCPPPTCTISSSSTQKGSSASSSPTSKLAPWNRSFVLFQSPTQQPGSCILRKSLTVGARPYEPASHLSAPAPQSYPVHNRCKLNHVDNLQSQTRTPPLHPSKRPKPSDEDFAAMLRGKRPRARHRSRSHLRRQQADRRHRRRHLRGHGLSSISATKPKASSPSPPSPATRRLVEVGDKIRVSVKGRDLGRLLRAFNRQRSQGPAAPKDYTFAGGSL